MNFERSPYNKSQDIYRRLYPQLVGQVSQPVTGYTLKEITFRDRYSEISPFDVDLTTEIKGLKLPFPLLSAAMDTLSGPHLGKALAEIGGCGILYRTKDPEKQLQWAREVVDHKPGLIPEPMCVHPEDSLEKAWDILSEHDFSTIPVVNGEKILKGILFTRDIAFKVKERMTESIQEWMVPFEELKVENLDTPYSKIKDRLLNEQRCSVLPIVNQDRQFQGIYFMKDFFNMNYASHEGKTLCGIAIGPETKDLERVEEALKIGVKIVVVDSSHGNCPPVIDQVKKVKELTGKQVMVIGGNIASIDGYLRLAEAGADAVKCGIGSGSICTTSQVTGAGAPMFTLIRELDYAKKYLDKKGLWSPAIIPDGGINGPGEMSIALAAGGDACMAGKWLVGFEESLSCQEGSITRDGCVYYRGMASKKAIEKRMASSRYGSQKRAAEGVEGEVPFRGAMKQSIGEDIELIKGGLAHAGAKTLTELHRIVENDPFFFVASNNLGQINPSV